MVVLEEGGMLTTGHNQYLQPDYLSPLPTVSIRVRSTYERSHLEFSRARFLLRDPTELDAVASVILDAFLLPLRVVSPSSLYLYYIR